MLRNKEYLYNIDDVVFTKNGKIKIISKIRTSDNRKGYIYKCLVDGNEGKISESNLKKVKVAQNVICLIKNVFEIPIDILKYLKNKNEANNETLFVRRRITVICPICGKEQEKSVG